MSRLVVTPARQALRGVATVPGDKSIGHRAVILAALGDGVATVRGLSGGEDNQRTVAALRALGIAIAELADGALQITGRGLDGLRPAREAAGIDCGNSGTTMRLLAGLLAVQPFASRLHGDGYLSRRPMARVLLPLREMGAQVSGSAGRDPAELYPPLTVGGGGVALRGIEHQPAAASAQVKTALLLAALYADGPTTVREPGRSRDHSERMLRALGVPLAVDGARVTLDPTGWERRLPARDWAVPGDLSTAAFLLGAATLVPGSEVVVRGVGVNPSRTGVLDALWAMGAQIEVAPRADEGGEPVAELSARFAPLRATAIRGELTVRAIDELPLLAALAAHADGVTEVRDAAELRVKESDRLAAMAAALAALGVRIGEHRDGWSIHGGRVHGGVVDSRGDHRIAMACAVAALAAEGPVTIEDTANVATSFPGFAAALRQLGAAIAETP